MLKDVHTLKTVYPFRFFLISFLSLGAAGPSTNFNSDVTISLSSPSGILCSLSYKVSSNGNPVTITRPFGSNNTVCLNWATNSAMKIN
uniref:CSON011227 protein n=1 Tax=Culicoides sonorensis TaxID=179676 RepID=A0A336M344_CULSO